MDFVKKLLERLQKQVAELNASQKMLAGALVAIMVMTLFFWTRYAGTAEFEPVLDQTLTAEETSNIKGFLSGKGYETKVVNDRVLVAADRKMEAIADLTFSERLPQDSTSGFDLMINKMTPWDSSQKTDVMWNHAKEITLASIIKRWPGVADSNVVINKNQRHELGKSDTTATINIKTRDRQSSRKLAKAAAALVRGAAAGLEVSNITVIVDGEYQSMDSDAALAAGSQEMELRQQNDKYYSDQVKKMLAYIPGNVLAIVSVEVNTKTTDTQSSKFDAKNTVSLPTETTNKTDESENGSRAAEPGVGANSQADIGSGSSGEHNKTNNTEETGKFSIFPSKIEEHSQENAGRATPKGASVRVPHSYFVQIFKAQNPKAADPDSATLKPIIDDELKRIREDVKKVTMLTDDAAVAVAEYFDAPSADELALTTTVSQPFAVTTLLTSHVKEVGVGALALISLFMVSMMVKKGTPAPAIVTVPDLPPGPITAGEFIAGEVSESNGSLEAMELDDESVKTQQVVGQVSTLVKENPDAAAALVKRWLNR